MRFNISCEIRIKCHVKVLKYLLPTCCQEKIRPEKSSFKFNEIKRIASVYFFLFNSQFTLVMGYEIHMTGSFTYLRKIQSSRVIP